MKGSRRALWTLLAKWFIQMWRTSFKRDTPLSYIHASFISDICYMTNSNVTHLIQTWHASILRTCLIHFWHMNIPWHISVSSTLYAVGQLSESSNLDFWRERGRERGRQRERERQRDRQRQTERDRMCVCVCVLPLKTEGPEKVIKAEREASNIADGSADDPCVCTHIHIHTHTYTGVVMSTWIVVVFRRPITFVIIRRLIEFVIVNWYRQRHRWRPSVWMRLYIHVEFISTLVYPHIYCLSS